MLEKSDVPHGRCSQQVLITDGTKTSTGNNDYHLLALTPHGLEMDVMHFLEAGQCNKHLRFSSKDVSSFSYCSRLSTISLILGMLLLFFPPFFALGRWLSSLREPTESSNKVRSFVSLLKLPVCSAMHVLTSG